MARDDAASGKLAAPRSTVEASALSLVHQCEFQDELLVRLCLADLKPGVGGIAGHQTIEIIGTDLCYRPDAGHCVHGSMPKSAGGV